MEDILPTIVCMYKRVKLEWGWETLSQSYTLTNDVHRFLWLRISSISVYVPVFTPSSRTSIWSRRTETVSSSCPISSLLCHVVYEQNLSTSPVARKLGRKTPRCISDPPSKQDRTGITVRSKTPPLRILMNVQSDGKQKPDLFNHIVPLLPLSLFRTIKGENRIWRLQFVLGPTTLFFWPRVEIVRLINGHSGTRTSEGCRHFSLIFKSECWVSDVTFKTYFTPVQSREETRS